MFEDLNPIIEAFAYLIRTGYLAKACEFTLSRIILRAYILHIDVSVFDMESLGKPLQDSLLSLGDYQYPAVGTILDHAYQAHACSQGNGFCPKAYSLHSAGDVGDKSHHLNKRKSSPGL